MAIKKQRTALVRLHAEKNGRPTRSAANVSQVLKLPEWGVIRWDEFGQEVVLRGQPEPKVCQVKGRSYPSVWSEDDTHRLGVHLERIYDLTVTPDMIGSAVGEHARRHPINGPRSYFGKIEWDGKKRVREFFTRYMGAPRGAYSEGIAECWLVSAVARVYEPGCQADYMVILKGPQGLGKTKALRTFFGPAWFSETSIDLDNKEAIQSLRGKLCVCFDELDSLKGRVRGERVKNFLTRTYDNIRLPYAKATIDIPRMCVFAGTTNEETFLTDITGNRRFWPIEVTRVDIKGLERDREQIWAEAVALYKKGVEWWPSEALGKLADTVQVENIVQHPWEDPVKRWLIANNQKWERGVRAVDILYHAIGKPVDRHTNFDMQILAQIMKRIGWSKQRLMHNGVREMRYYPGVPGAIKTPPVTEN